jgi:hypothetical protein
MTEQHDGPALPTPEPQPTQPVLPPLAAPVVEEPSRTRVRDLTFRTWAVAGVAAAALLVGGGVGAAIGVAASGDDHPGGPDRMNVGRPPGGPGGPSSDQGPNGQLPPDTAPQG